LELIGREQVQSESPSNKQTLYPGNFKILLFTLHKNSNNNFTKFVQMVFQELQFSNCAFTKHNLQTDRTNKAMNSSKAMYFEANFRPGKRQRG